MNSRSTLVMKASLRRGLALLGIWLGLSGGEAVTAAFGLVPIVAATAVSLSVLPPSHSAIKWQRFPGFLLGFGLTSLLAGLDVARRALARTPDLTPDLVVLRLSLPTTRQRVLLANLVTLLPGTLATDLDGFELKVHALDGRQDIAARVKALEARIFDLGFGASNASNE
jgi:multicomponent Na+:H+ antiporter subunit E